MGIVWLIENDKAKLKLTWLIMAKYATRVFQSLPSCLYLMKSSVLLPNLIVINDDDGISSPLLTMLQNNIGKIPLVAISSGHTGDNSAFACINPNFNDQEILREIEIHLRPYVATGSSSICYKDIHLNKEENTLLLEGMEEVIPLTTVEAKILKLLIKTPEKHISRQELSEAVWGRIKVAPRTLDTHICRLRSKMHSSEVRIASHYASGYSLE